MWSRVVNARASWHNAMRIHRWVAAEEVMLDVLHVHSVGHARNLIYVLQVIE